MIATIKKEPMLRIFIAASAHYSNYTTSSGVMSIKERMYEV